MISYAWRATQTDATSVSATSAGTANAIGKTARQATAATRRPRPTLRLTRSRSATNASRYSAGPTQSAKATYALSDFPMPKKYPEWPTGEQVQAWLADYARQFTVDQHVRLNTEVTRATQVGDGWRLELRSMVDGAESTESVDRLVVANGVFCEPNMPVFPGYEEFAAAGGRLRAGTELRFGTPKPATPDDSKP